MVSCLSIETNNAEKAYKHWSKSEVPDQIELIKGQYYQSPHFSLEYELFLKFKAEDEWFNSFLEHNQLEKDTIKNEWSLWTDLPEWFQIDEGFEIYAKNQSDVFERSRYMRNPKTGICYIYETLGM